MLNPITLYGAEGSGFITVEAAPKMTFIVRRVDAEPRLADFWAKRLPFDEGWE